jgi:hypothetical protein
MNVDEELPSDVFLVKPLDKMDYPAINNLKGGI